MIETALGRLVEEHEAATVLKDAILQVLFVFRMHPQNANGAPMRLSALAHGLTAPMNLVLAAVEDLKHERLVEEGPEFHPGLLSRQPRSRTFRITGPGVTFVRNMHQGVMSVMP